LDGAIVIDKPEGWTSHDVVNKLRRIAQTKRIGHLGTLDPIATGVLPLVVGRATRLAQFYTRGDKTYEGSVRFGWATNTYDRAGEPCGEPREVKLDAATLEPLLERFRGEIDQTPPPVSAKKVAGRRAYELARKDIAVELPPSRVHIYELTVLAIENDTIRLRVRCSGGTYVRSIAHDLGQAVGCGAHLSELRRIASSEFKITHARTIAELETMAGEGRLDDAIVPMSNLLPAFPTIFIDDITTTQIRHGRNFHASPFRSQADAKHVKAIAAQSELIAIGEAVLPNVYHPCVVL
jgi:tRNA pseudouridine55 synthase